jgi:hypothetical protein
VTEQEIRARLSGSDLSIFEQAVKRLIDNQVAEIAELRAALSAQLPLPSRELPPLPFTALSSKESGSLYTIEDMHAYARAALCAQPSRKAVTVWKDGTYKLWAALDASYAESDPDWLCTIPICRSDAPAQTLGIDWINDDGSHQFMLVEDAAKFFKDHFAASPQGAALPSRDERAAARYREARRHPYVHGIFHHPTDQ